VCSFNYWWPNASAPHAVTNLSRPTPYDDAAYVADVFDRFVGEQATEARPFLAQLSFHNCHSPFVGSEERRAACARGTSCRLPADGETAYTHTEADYYACISMFDDAVGAVLKSVQVHGYAHDTLTWLTTDNGPEVLCQPKGICRGRAGRPKQAPGSAGPLRGRKRDVWEGGHRVPGIVNFPRLVRGTHESWATVTTMDLLPTMVELLGNVTWPAAQADWAVDGTSIAPILRDGAHGTLPQRGVGWAYKSIDATPRLGYAFRYGKWKLAVGGASCSHPECARPMLFDLDADLGERHDLSEQRPDVLAMIIANFSAWQQSVRHSRANESQCKTNLGYQNCGTMRRISSRHVDIFVPP